MSQAAWTFVGVILGAIIAGGVSLWREQVITARERAAKQAEREQARRDAHDAFQRDAILALQAAEANILQQSMDAYSKAVEAWKTTGQWSPPSADMAPFMHAESLRARVFDDELRQLASELLVAVVRMVSADDYWSAVMRMNAIAEPNERLQQRINVLLKELF